MKFGWTLSNQKIHALEYLVQRILSTYQSGCLEKYTYVFNKI
jgi:hypothetical protein